MAHLHRAELVDQGPECVAAALLIPLSINPVEKGVKVGKCRRRGGRIEESSGLCPIAADAQQREPVPEYLVRSSRSSCVEMGAFCGSG